MGVRKAMLTACPSGPAAIVATMTDSSDVLAAEFVPATAGIELEAQGTHAVPEGAETCR